MFNISKNYNNYIKVNLIKPNFSNLLYSYYFFYFFKS